MFHDCVRLDQSSNVLFLDIVLLDLRIYSVCMRECVDLDVPLFFTDLFSFVFLQWTVISPWCGRAVFFPPPLSLAASSVIQFHNRVSSPSSCRIHLCITSSPHDSLQSLPPCRSCLSPVIFFNLTIEKPLQYLGLVCAPDVLEMERICGGLWKL